ncbi:DPP IV N-terminal domain-containing protein, partial [Flavihumibacter sediminis]|nr:DPP IV N-terminal domain-containing protein [Flavihumibacter sediminis]
TYFNDLQVKEVATGKTTAITGLPADLRGTSMQWSPSQQRFAFLQYSNSGIDLYTVDLLNATAKKVNQHPLNDVLGTSFIWQNDSTIIYKAAVNAGKKEP